MRGTRISAINRVAAQAGATIGQRLNDARAACPLIGVEQGDPESDAAFLTRLANWALRYSPIVMVDDVGGADNPGDGLLIDIKGCDHLFGGEKKLVADIIARLAHAGFTAHVGLADTLSAAWALARFGAGGEAGLIAPIGESLTMTHLLPVAALRLDDAVVLLLTRLGLKTVGQLAEVPRVALERRFHSRIKVSKTSNKNAVRSVQLRLDQLSGAIREPLHPLRPPAPFESRMPCPEPALDQAAICFGLNELLLRLQYRLEKSGVGGRLFRFTAFHADGGHSTLQVRLSRPGREAGTIARLFNDRLEQIDPGFGIDAFLLTAEDIGAMDCPQKSLVAGGNKNADAAEVAALVDTLSNRVGAENVTRMAPAASHLPERRWVSVEVGNAVRWVEEERDENEAALRTFAPAPRRPTRLFNRPEPVEAIAEVPDGPPLRFTWRRVPRAIIRASGPERIAGEWWREATQPTRDYYQVEDREGRCYWLYRAGLYGDDDFYDGQPRWFVHGMF